MAILLTVAALFVSVVSIGAHAQGNVILTQIVHRHGARTSLVPTNQATICGSEPCGTLTDNGKKMLETLGAAMKTRTTALFPSTYDPSKVYTRSTAFPRTLQSAASFIKGAFTDASGEFPVIFSVPKETDELLLSDSWPSLAFYLAANRPSFATTVDTQRKTLITDAVMDELATETGLGTICADMGYGGCALVFYDVAESMDAAGVLSATYPKLNANYASLQTIARAYFTLEFGTDASKKALGSAGQPIARGLLSNMDAFIAGTLTTPVIEYSAHDSTVTPLGVTIGDSGDDIMLPVFGTFIALDLVKDGSDYFVQAVKGAPSGSAGTYTYTPVAAKLGGIGTDGVTYYTDGTTTRIPLADFNRFVASSAPSGSDRGACAVPQSLLDANSCMASGATESALCKIYRSNCQNWACGTGMMLEYPSLSCVGGNAKSKASMSTANAGVMAMCTTFGGMLIGAGAMFAMNHFKKKREKEAGYESVAVNA